MDEQTDRISLQALVLLIQLLAREMRQIETTIKNAGLEDCSDDQIYLYDCSRAAGELKSLYEGEIKSYAVSNFPAYADLITPSR